MKIKGVVVINKIALLSPGKGPKIKVINSQEKLRN
jgi:hypothetical protein